MRVFVFLMIGLLAACGSAPPKSSVFSVPDPAPYDSGQTTAGGAILKGVLP